MPFFAKLSTFSQFAPPCGVAEACATNTLGVRETMQHKLVGGSITEAYGFIKTGKAEPGFVALSMLTHRGIASRRLVPQESYDPFRQHALLLEAHSKGGCDIVYLKRPETLASVARHGSVRQAQG